MIPWWGWLIIWVCLALALIAVLVVSAWRLFRKAMTVLDDLGDLASKTEILDVAEAQLSKPQIAILLELAEVRRRNDVRRERRQKRKAARHDRRIERAHRIGSVDIATTRWPERWYGR